MAKLKDDPKYGDFKELFDELFDERLEIVLKNKMKAEEPKKVEEPKKAEEPKEDKSLFDIIFGN